MLEAMISILYVLSHYNDRPRAMVIAMYEV